MKKYATQCRILGFIVLLVPIAGYFAKIGGSAILGIAGLALFLSTNKHAHDMLALFKESFKKFKTTFFAFLFDAMFFMLFITGFFFLQKFLNRIAESIGAKTDLTQTALLDPQLVAQNAAALRELLIYLVISAVLMISFSLLVYTFSRLFLWAEITGKKPNKKLFWKHVGYTAIWWVIWTPIILFFTMATAQNKAALPVLIFVMLLSVYFTLISQSIFAKTQKTGHSIGHGIGWGIAKIPQLIVPFSLAFIVAAALSQLFILLRLVPAGVWPFVQLIVFLIYLNWLRVYAYSVVSGFSD